MATKKSTITEPPSGDTLRIELALQALAQIDALLPLAQRSADVGGEPDLLLGLLGRIRQMTNAATALLADAHEVDLVRWRYDVLGIREVSHG